MTANQVHAALQNDAAYTTSRDNYSQGNLGQAVADMIIILAAHGYKNTINHAIHMCEFTA
tara:strand:+ start:622 stop:801 length:180 start_codon:yes stop_codon:yes gene_type:complete